MAAPTITSASVGESGHDLTLVFSAAVNQVAPTGLGLQIAGKTVEVALYRWLSTTSLLARMLRPAAKTDAVTYSLASSNISDVATSTAIANVSSGATTNGSTARLLRSHNGARLRY